MVDFVEFWDSLGVNGYFLVLVVVLFFCHLFYLIYRGSVVRAKDKVTVNGEEEGVSVVITSNNKADCLRKNLEYFLRQNHSNFEVVVVDECSEDDTQDVLSDLKQKYPNLKTTRIFPDTKFHSTKKIAINIGVLAASHDILLFSEINCRPASENWVRTMQAYFDPNTAVVVGYSNYVENKENISIKRYFRFLRYLKMMMLVKSGSNVLGDGCNMAYRKKYYIEKRGFAKNSQIYMGYDNEMVKELSKKGSVKVVKNSDANVIINDTRKKTWIEDYSYYYASKRDWPNFTLFKSELGSWSKFLFYILSFYLLFSIILHKYVLILILLTFLMDLIAINVYLNRLGQKKLFLTSFIVNTVGFLYGWYYNVYSIFTSKKWR